MLHFDCDYMEGAHPKIMERLMETNLMKTPGYGTDAFCESAREKIRTACNAPEAEVYFLPGGTQTNALVIAAALRPHQGVIAPVSGHINVHETGAIEHSGHKVLALQAEDGLLSAETIRKAMEDKDFMIGVG